MFTGAAPRPPANRRMWLAAILLSCAIGAIVLASARPGMAAADTPPAPRPPTGVTAHDTPNDNGGSITIRWSPSPDDAADQKAFLGYAISRAISVSGPFERVGTVPRGTGEYTDVDSLEDGVAYYYEVASRAGDPEATGPPSEAARAASSPQWFHRGRLNSLIAVLILSGLIIYFIEHARRGGNIFIRKIAGLDAVDEAVGRATEMGRKVLYIPGTSDMDNVMTLAGIAILGRVARLTAQYETPLDIPVSRSLVMVACRETVKESYLAEGRPDDYSDSMVYYLTDDQFGYAAAIDGIMVRERPATVFMQGNFYAESLILAETGNSVGAIQIAGTAQASQLPFFVAACDYTLIGEELFVAGAYLSKEPRQLGSLKGQDIGKAIILVLLLLGIIVQTARIFDFSSLFVVQ